MNYVISGIAFLSVLLAGWLTWKRFGTCFTPWFLLWASQAGSISIYYLKQYSLATDFHPLTWFAILSFIFSFLFGNIFAAKLVPSIKMVPQSQIHDRRMLATFLILASAAMFGMTIGYLKTRGWPMFMADKETARMTFASIPWYGSYSFQAVTAMGFFAWYFILCGNKSLKFVGFFGVFLILWVAGAIGMRGYLIFSFVIALAILDARRAPVSPQKLALSLFAVISLFLLIFLIRFSDAAFSDLSSKISFSTKLKILFEPLYIYFSNNFWNLDSEITRLQTSHEQIFSPGYWTFTGLFYFTNFPGTLNSAYGFTAQYNQLLKVENLNTSPIQWNIFADWGWFGLFFGGFVFGFFAWYFFAKRNVSFYHLAMYAVFSLSCALSFFVNAFMLPDVILLFFMALLFRGFSKAIQPSAENQCLST